MYVVGLTGGIASGKTTISEMFQALGAAIIDTDMISRRLLEPGQKGFAKVVEKFGKGILLDTGEIDRRRLRQLVFNDNKLKIWLESILHPLIFESCRQEIDCVKDSNYVLLVVPLLFESGFTALVDRVLAVDCSKSVQLNRLTNRDKIDIDLAEKMMAQQLSNEERINLADDIINNNGEEAELPAHVQHLHQQYSLKGKTEIA